jgi:hypothetical protein
VATEVFANDPSGIVTSGGTGVPAAGTQETWTLAAYASFPAASAAASPPTQFHITDIAAPAELITVSNTSGATWTVTRGAEGTAPLAHAPPFTVVQVTTAGFLGGLAQLASPAFTGTPTAPTAPALTASTRLATTAYADSAVAIETTRAEAAEAGLVAAGGDVAASGRLLDLVSLRRFGVDLTGATDSSAALASALASGEPLWVPSGALISVAAPVVVPSGAVLTGGGPGSHLFTQTGVVNGSPGTYFAMFEVDSVNGVLLQGLDLAGQNTSVTAMALGGQAAGILVSPSGGLYTNAGTPSSNVKIIDCRAQYFWGEGFQSFGQTTGFQMIACEASNNGKDGFNLSSQGGLYAGCVARGNAYNGFEMQMTDSVITGAVASGNLQAGIALVNGSGNAVSAAQTYGNGTGLEFNGETSSVASGLVTWANTVNGIQFSSAVNCDAVNAKVFSNGCLPTSGSNRIGILNSVSTGTRIVGCDVRNTPAISGYGHYAGIFDYASTGTDVRDSNSVGGTSLDYWFSSTTSMLFFGVKNAASVIQYTSGLSIAQADVTLSGSPLNVVPAGVGSVALSTTGGSGTTLYVKEAASSGADKTGWTAFASASAANPVGSQVAFAQVTAGCSQLLVISTWTLITGAPAVTLPNDGHTYRIELTIPGITLSTTANAYIGLGTSASVIIAQAVNSLGPTAASRNLVAQQVTGSGQTISVYGQCGSAYTMSFSATASGPIQLGAYRVA